MGRRSPDWGVYGWWCLDCDHPYSDHRQSSGEVDFTCRRSGCVCTVKGTDEDRIVGLNEADFRARLRYRELTFLDGTAP